jgi:hypothetical protein
MTDSNSPMEAERIPYELDSFAQLGLLVDPHEVFDRGEPWKPKAGRDWDPSSK